MISFLDGGPASPQLDQRFPAMAPGPSSPSPVRRATSLNQQSQRNASVSNISPSVRFDLSHELTRGSIWKESEVEYTLKRGAETPPELRSVRGLDLAHLRDYVNSRTGQEHEQVTKEERPDETKIPTHVETDDTDRTRPDQSPQDAPCHVPTVSTKDLSTTVECLRAEMKDLKAQMTQLQTALELAVDNARAGVNTAGIGTCDQTQTLVGHNFPVVSTAPLRSPKGKC